MKNCRVHPTHWLISTQRVALLLPPFIRPVCGDSGMPPVQLLGTVVGTLLAERRATALLVGELVRVQEAVVELSA